MGTLCDWLVSAWQYTYLLHDTSILLVGGYGYSKQHDIRHIIDKHDNTILAPTSRGDSYVCSDITNGRQPHGNHLKSYLYHTMSHWWGGRQHRVRAVSVLRSDGSVEVLC